MLTPAVQRSHNQCSRVERVESQSAKAEIQIASRDRSDISPGAVSQIVAPNGPQCPIIRPSAIGISDVQCLLCRLDLAFVREVCRWLARDSTPCRPSICRYPNGLHSTVARRPDKNSRRGAVRCGGRRIEGYPRDPNNVAVISCRIGWVRNVIANSRET